MKTQINVTSLIEGSRFELDEELFEVEKNDGQFVEAKSLNDKIGLILTTGDKVEIHEDVKEIYEYKFVQISKNQFQLTRKKISRPF